MIKSPLLHWPTVRKALSPSDIWLPLLMLMAITWYFWSRITGGTALTMSIFALGIYAAIMLGLIQAAGGDMNPWKVVGFFLLSEPLAVMAYSVLPASISPYIIYAFVTAAMIKIIFSKVKTQDALILGGLQQVIVFVLMKIMAAGVFGVLAMVPM